MLKAQQYFAQSKLHLVTFCVAHKMAELLCLKLTANLHTSSKVIKEMCFKSLRLLCNHTIQWQQSTITYSKTPFSASLGRCKDTHKRFSNAHYFKVNTRFQPDFIFLNVIIYN